MKYMGSKNRIAKHILPIILKDRKENQWYVEPFCGGCNTLDKVGGNRIGNDIHPELISFCDALSKGWMPPKDVSKDLYESIKRNPEEFESRLVGYVGFQLSFGAKWFGGYRRDNIGKRDYSLEAYRNVESQSPKLAGVKFFNKNYWELDIPDNSIVYCDPPYKGTTKYSNKGGFDHDKFWGWCEDMAADGHRVFVSEYCAPDGWVSVWEKEVTTGLDVKTTKKDVEKLFVFDEKES